MAREKVYHRCTLPGDREVVFQELTLGAMKTLVNSKKDHFESTLDGLRRSIVKVEGVEVDHKDLAGGKLDDYFNVREVTLLTSVFEEIHAASQEDLEAVKKSMKTTVGGGI